MGLRVDELVGIQEVVLKSLGRNFRGIPGLSGASILGDGRVSLILDIDTVIGLACNGICPACGDAALQQKGGGYVCDSCGAAPGMMG